MREWRRHLTLVAGILVLSSLGTEATVQAREVPAQNSSQSQASKTAAASGVHATVSTDGALVYAAASEDSSVIGQLPKGQKVQVSKATTGQGRGRFRKVRIGRRIGYLEDADVLIEGAPVLGRVAQSPEKRADGKSDKKKKKKKHVPEKPQEPMYFSRFVGLAVGSSEYKEGISNVNSSTQFLVYGMKLTGPDVFFKGPVMDVNLLLHYGPPDYYRALSSSQPNGFVIFADSMFVLPFLQKQNGLIYGSAGPLLVYSKYSVINGGRLMDLQALNFGVDAALGGAIRVAKVALRIEAKYYLERQSYKAILGSLQTEF